MYTADRTMESAETKNQRRKQRKKLRREQKPAVDATDTTLSKDDVEMDVDGVPAPLPAESSLVPIMKWKSKSKSPKSS